MNKQIISNEDKIKQIEKTNSLNEVSLECLPPVQTDKYYFVSYSHKDYKLVYKDIFYLQQKGLSIWYDRGMEAGKNWKDTAEKYITKHNCCGVIFFLSENSILSDAIHEEIKLLMENGKEFLTINLPVNGEYMSAQEMLDLIKQKGIKIDEENDQFISKHLNKDIIYVRYDSSYDEKIEKINTLKSSPLFKINTFDAFAFIHEMEDELLTYKHIYHNKDFGKYYLESTAINDIDVKEVKLIDFKNSLNENHNLNNFVKIGASTFSNCRRLKNIELPDETSVIGSYAFYNCEKLENIDLSNIYLIEDHAFENCYKLKYADLSSLENSNVISDYIFRNCTSLEEIKAPKMLNKIGSFSFENTKIKSFKTNYLYGHGICSYAFNDCKNLETFNILDDGDFEIEKSAFAGCDNLKEFTLRKGKIKVGEKAFENCKNLTTFPFNLITEISDSSFKDCEGLTELNINAIEINAYAFEGCKNITEITFNPVNKYEIGFFSFGNLTNLKKIVFAPKLYFVNAMAFAHCINLETIYLPLDVFHIDQDAFFNCTSLKEIYFEGTVNQFKQLMEQNYSEPWFNETGEYIVICKDRTLSKYEFKD